MKIESRATFAPAQASSFPATSRGVEIRPIGTSTPRVDRSRTIVPVTKIGNREVAQPQFNFGKPGSIHSQERAITKRQPNIASEVRSSIKPELAVKHRQPSAHPDKQIKRFHSSEWSVIARPRPHVTRLDIPSTGMPKKEFVSSVRSSNPSSEKIRASHETRTHFRRRMTPFDNVQARFPHKQEMQWLRRTSDAPVRQMREALVMKRHETIYDRTKPVALLAQDYKEKVQVSPMRRPQYVRSGSVLQPRIGTPPRETYAVQLPQSRKETSLQPLSTHDIPNRQAHMPRIETRTSRLYPQPDVRLGKTERQVNRLENIIRLREARIASRPKEIREAARQQMQLEQQKVRTIRESLRNVQAQEQAKQYMQIAKKTSQSPAESRQAYLRLQKEIKCRMVCIAMQKPLEGRPCRPQKQEVMLGMPRFPEFKFVRDERTNEIRDTFITRLYRRLSKGGRRPVSGGEMAEHMPQTRSIKSKVRIILETRADYGWSVLKEKMRTMGTFWNANHLARSSRPLVEEHTAIIYRTQGTPVSERWVDTVFGGGSAKPIKMPAAA